MVVKKMDMIMVECVVRGYLYGSLMDRAKKGEVSLPVETVLAAKLPGPTSTRRRSPTSRTSP